MKFYKYLFLSLSLFVFTQPAFSQKNRNIYKEATVELHNGSIIKGELLEMNDEIVKVSIIGGSIFVYPRSEVKSVEIAETKTYSVVNTFKYKREGMYYGLHINLNANANDAGAGLTGMIGYQYNNYLAGGIGASFNQISVNNGIQTMPLFLEIRGHASKGPVTPFYSIAGGYGWAFPNSQFDVIEAKGGLMLHPTLGMRFDRYSGSAFLIDFGYHFQNVEITTQGWGGINIDDIQYRRFMVRLGWIF